MAFGDLTTLANVKAYLKTGDNDLSSDDDALLSRLISSASQFIESWLSRTIPSADYIETRPCLGNSKFVFGNYPVTAVASVTVDLTAIPPAPSVIAGGYLFTPSMLTIQGYLVPRGSLLTVQYTAGYSAIPPDIEQACIELVVYRYKERDRMGVTTTNMNGVQTASYRVSDMLPETKTLLMQYRNVVPANPSARIVLAPTQTDPATLVAAI